HPPPRFPQTTTAWQPNPPDLPSCGIRSARTLCFSVNSSFTGPAVGWPNGRTLVVDPTARTGKRPLPDGRIERPVRHAHAGAAPRSRRYHGLEPAPVGSAGGAQFRAALPTGSGFLPPPPRTVRAVFPHTAHRRPSPPAFGHP